MCLMSLSSHFRYELLNRLLIGHLSILEEFKNEVTCFYFYSAHLRLAVWRSNKENKKAIAYSIQNCKLKSRKHGVGKTLFYVSFIKTILPKSLASEVVVDGVKYTEYVYSLWHSRVHNVTLWGFLINPTSSSKLIRAITFFYNKQFLAKTYV